MRMGYAVLLAVQDYGLAAALTGLAIVFGLLVICIPRPRRSDVPKPRE